MKTIIVTLSILMAMALNVNGQDTDVKKLLDNEESRTEIFNAIASDMQLMMDFIQVAKENEHAAMIMRNTDKEKWDKMESKKDGMKDMSDENHMENMMKEKPEMMKKMMGNMMEMLEKDAAMRTQMANIMSEHPEMMKMYMQKMKEKGMIDTDCEMMDMEGKSKHNNH